MKHRSETNLSGTNTRAAVGSILVVSGAAITFLLWLIYFKPTSPEFANSLTFLPALNAVLNGLSAVAMCCGLFYILKGKPQIHRRFMIAAFIFSSIFLVGYILHHYLHGDTKFLGTGSVRYVYFFILITHILLSIIALPFILTTFFLSLSGRFRLHKRIARFTFPVWLYVSVTGVIVFLLLRSYAN